MDTAKIRISLIIPFYGVESYIGKCLSTVYEQDISEDEYEVICINDCSPDNSEEIVLEYAAKHSNLKLLKHDVNLKLGAARNTGLRAAKGRYVWFIDSDDYIKSNCLREILSYCEKNNLEIFHFGIQNNKGHIVRHLIDTDVITGPEEEIISKKQQSIEITFPWNRIYSVFHKYTLMLNQSMERLEIKRYKSCNKGDMGTSSGSYSNKSTVKQEEKNETFMRQLGKRCEHCTPFTLSD